MADVTVYGVVGDTHGGSTVALCPPTVHLDDGGSYHASSAQMWLWDNWRRFWDRVEEVRAEYDADLGIIANGDLVDGDHHDTPQILSRHPGAQWDVTRQVWDIPLSSSPSQVFVIRGTEAHVGRSASVEEALAKKWLEDGHPVVPDPDTGNASWWHLEMVERGVKIDVAHHGRAGRRPWTKGNVPAMYAAQIFYEHAADFHRYGDPADRPPDLAIRSHQHQSVDTGDIQPTRLIQLGAWQLKTAFIQRIGPDALSDVEGLIVVVKDGAYEVEHVQFKPKRTVYQGNPR